MKINMDIKKVNSNKKININNNFNPSEININNINVTKSNVNTNNLDKEVEYVDFSESNIKEEEYEEYLKEVEIYKKDLDIQKKDYETELKYIEDRLAALKWMTEIEPGEMTQHQLTGETLGYDKIAEEIKKEYNTKEKIEEYKQQLEEDKITLNAAIYKLEQLKKTAKYDNLKNLKEYQDFEVTTKHHQDEIDRQFDEYNKFAQKQKIEVDSSNYINDELALLIELNDEESIKIYNYLYEKEGKDEADKYLDDIKDTLHDQVGMLRAQEYLSKLEKDENGNYDNKSIMNHLNTSIKGGTAGVKSFFKGLKTWFEKDQIYSTDEYEAMYILQALQENKSFTNFLDNNFEISQSVGNMLPSVIIGQVACPLLGTISMGASAGGNSYHQARVSGKSTGASISYGVLSGVSETTLQHFLGAIPGLNDVSVTSVKTFVQSMGKEGFEEFVQEYIDAGLQDIVLNEKQDLSEVTKNAGKSFIYGAITSSIFTSTSVATEKISNKLDQSTTRIPKSNIDVTEDLSLSKNSSNTNQNTKNNNEKSFLNLKLESNELDYNSILLDYINVFTTDLESFTNLLEKIRNYSNENIPKEYSNVTDYKKDFVRTLINSGKINELDNNYIYQLTRDPTMLTELIGTENLNNLYIKNLSRLPKLLVPTLSSIGIPEFNKLFNTPTMKNYINSLTPQELGEILKYFNQSNDSNVSWLSNDIIINKIINMDTDDFYKFVDSLGYYKSEIENYIKAEKDTSNYLILLDKIKDKFYTIEFILNNISYRDKIDNILATFTDNELVNEKVKEIQQIDNLIKNKIISTFQNSSEIEFDISLYDVNINVDPSYEYYDLIIEIDQHLEKITLNQNFGKVGILYTLINKPYYASAVLDGNLKIKSISPNMKKSNLVLTKEMGLRNGLNEVTLLLDGIEKTIIVNAEDDVKDLNFSYKDKFANVKDVQVKSINALGTKNIDVDDPNSLYTVSYKIGDKNHKIFMKTNPQSFISKIGEKTLNIDEYISNNNLIGISDIQVSKTTKEQIKENFPNIENYKASSEIYNTFQYGGNQSDVYNLLDNSINGKILSSIDTKKAQILNNLIDKYFPNSTDIQKLNLATHYANGGCCWMAVANAFATYMGSIDDGKTIFKNKIGFDLTINDENLTSYNVEAIAFDMYLSYFSELCDGNIEFLFSKNNGSGISAIEFNDKISNYFTNRGINIESNTNFKLSDYSNLYNELLQMILNNKNGFNILSASNFDMKLMDIGIENLDSLDNALTTSKTDGNIKKGVGGHAMLVTGLDENMNLLVSSWSRKYQFMVESVENYKAIGQNSHASIWNIKFSLPNNNLK